MTTTGLRRTLFGLSFALYLVAGLAWNAAVGLSGDEPHYLVIAHSILVDHDLNIENNHARRDYAAFYPGTLRPDYLARGTHGEIYSIHAPGLPALLVPAYALAGARGAIVLVALIAALAALAIFDAARLLGGAAAGWFTWAAICLTVPFLPHAWLIYPEIVAALIVAWAVRWLVERRPVPNWRWCARGVALGVLPWLHTKYAILLAPLAMAVAWNLWMGDRHGGTATKDTTDEKDRLRQRAGAIVAFGLPIAIALAAWFVSFDVMYGVFDPQAPYGSYTAMYVRTSNIARGVLGLLIDQKFGLLVYAPVYLLALVGAAALVRRRAHRVLAVAVAVTTILFVASTARFYMWWGGASAPGRFLVPILPLLAVPVALALNEWRRLAAWTLAASLAISLPAIAAPAGQWLFSDPHGTSRLMTWLQGPAPLTAAWPTFTEPEWRPAIPRALAAAAGRFSPSARLDTAEHGRENLIAAFDDGRLRAWDYGVGARADAAFVLAHAALHRTRRDGDLNDDPARLAGPFDLAAGEYAVRVWFTGEPAPAVVHYHRGPALATFGPAVPSPAVEGRLSFPVDAPVVWVGVADAAIAARVTAVDIVPLSIVPASVRPRVEPTAIEPLEGGGLLVYGDRNSYPENGVFWTRGTRTATVYVAPGTARRLTATLHVGPNGGTVTVVVNGQRHAIPIPAGGTADLAVPIDRPDALIPVTIAAPASFVPALTDPKSDDARSLGCQVRIRLS